MIDKNKVTFHNCGGLQMKKIIDKEELAPKIVEGVSKIAAPVKRTLGPGGLPILIERIGQQLNGDPLGPKITKDGVSVADECYDSDPEIDLIIQAVKAICRKTNTVAGDGTTTAIVLGESILKETLSMLKEDPTLNPQLVRESVEETSKSVIEILKKMATPAKNIETISQVATISANGESEIGKVISQAFDKVGAEGVVTVDEGHGLHTTLDIVEGYQISRGGEKRDAFFNSKDMTHYEAEDASVILFDGKLQNYTHLRAALMVIGQANDGKIPPMVVIANEFSHEVIQWMHIQKTEMGMQIIPVRGPHTTHVRSGYYDDMAVMLGGTKMGGGNRNLTDFKPDDAGLVSKVVIDKYTSTFYEGQGDEDEILNRVQQLKALKSRAESPYDAQVISDRIAALTQGIAKIGVGGATELEIKEKYDRIEDALNAARAAIQEGIVPGGGATLLRIAELLPGQTVGERILKKALKAPFYQILENIGRQADFGKIEEILETENQVYDARNNKIVDSLQAGIIDPVKVTRTALENATSIAALLSTAGGGITIERRKN